MSRTLPPPRFDDPAVFGRVAVLMGNVPAWPEALFACAAIGTVCVPGNVLLNGREVDHVVRDCGAVALVADRVAERALADLSTLPAVLIKVGDFEQPSGGSWLAYEDLVGRAAAGGERQVRFADIAAVVARQMPPDPPYERAVVVDLVPAGAPPFRLLTSTRVNYGAMPGGAGTTALDNLRRLVRLVAQAGRADLDDPTRAFAEGKPPAAFAASKSFTSWPRR